MGEPAMIRAYDGMFLNSKAVFIEYVDAVKSPYLAFLVALAATGEDFKGPFDLTKIKNMEIEQLYQWYFSRKHQNPLYDLLTEEGFANCDFKKLDEMMDLQITEDLINICEPLNFVGVLERLYVLNPDLAGGLYVWYPYENKDIIADIKSTFDFMNSLHVLTGPIEEALTKVPKDSTFIFSDATNVNVLSDIGALDFSSVILPVEYGYNKIDGELILNIEQISKDHPFKINQALYALSLESISVDESEIYEGDQEIEDEYEDVDDTDE